MSQYLPSTKGPIEQSVQQSQLSSSVIQKHVRYHRHLSSQYTPTPSRGRSRLVIHTTVRSPKNNRRQKENRSIDPDHHIDSTSTIPTHQDKANNWNIASNSADHMRNARRSISFDKYPRSLPTSIHSSRIDNNVRVYFQEPNSYLPKTKENITINNKRNYGRIFERGIISSNSVKSVNNKNSSVTENHNETAEKKNFWSNTTDFHKDSIRNKKKRNKYPCACPCSCACILASLLAALLVGIAVAVALVATLVKHQTTTTQSTTEGITATTLTTLSIYTVTTTTASSTTLTTTASSTTLTTTVGSTVISTTTQTTTTSTSCTTPTSTDLYYSPGPSTFTAATYDYIASSTTTAVLEFGFQGQTGSDLWYLDDVSVVDTNSSNSEMLINGGFENGSLVGWQVLCSTGCHSSPGSLGNASCRTDLYCYQDGCKSQFDFLRQTFTTIIGHVYTLTFWYKSDFHNSQKAFVRIF